MKKLVYWLFKTILIIILLTLIWTPNMITRGDEILFVIIGCFGIDFCGWFKYKDLLNRKKI